MLVSKGKAAMIGGVFCGWAGLAHFWWWMDANADARGCRYAGLLEWAGMFGCFGSVCGWHSRISFASAAQPQAPIKFRHGKCVNKFITHIWLRGGFCSAPQLPLDRIRISVARCVVFDAWPWVIRNQNVSRLATQSFNSIYRARSTDFPSKYEFGKRLKRFKDARMGLRWIGLPRIVCPCPMAKDNCLSLARQMGVQIACGTHSLTYSVITDPNRSPKRLRMHLIYY